jgi:hypothetical protein
MNANIQELWKEIENQNIKDVESFDIYVKKHDFYSIIKSTENIDLKNIWINIQKEYMTNILINALDIENVDLWLSKTEKKLKYKSNKLKRRIFKLRDLFDTKYKN